MTSPISLVREFHERFEQRICSKPCIDDEATNLLRVKLIAEELDELCEALGLPLTVELRPRSPIPADPVAVLDALTDLTYVLAGSYISLGYADMADAALAEVHRSNMTKLGADGRPVYLPSGKVTKGEAYEPPDLRSIVRGLK